MQEAIHLEIETAFGKILKNKIEGDCKGQKNRKEKVARNQQKRRIINHNINESTKFKEYIMQNKFLVGFKPITKKKNQEFVSQ